MWSRGWSRVESGTAAALSLPREQTSPAGEAAGRLGSMGYAEVVQGAESGLQHLWRFSRHASITE
jgi:hypothetical protein